MSVGLRNSTIETFRRRTHGAAVLRLYSLHADGESLSLLHTVEQGFFIGRNPDTMEGAPPHLLTCDMAYTPNLTEVVFQRAFMCELDNPNTGHKQRYSFTTNTTPMVDDWRYVCGLHPAYGDKRAVI